MIRVHVRSTVLSRLRGIKPGTAVDTAQRRLWSKTERCVEGTQGCAQSFFEDGW